MTHFGKTLFGGGRFIFWSLTPVIFLFLISVSFFVPEWRAGIVLMLVAFWVIGISLILGMLNPLRFGWAFRIVSAMVFLAYVAYFFTEMLENDWQLKMPRSRGETNAVNALLGLVIIGGPALMYTLLGRFTFRKEEDVPFENNEMNEDN